MAELGLDVGMLVSQIVNFSLLAVLLTALLYKPILGKLEERAARIRKGLEDAEQAEALLAEAKGHRDAEIDRARREAREVVERATRAAEQQRQEILAQARLEAHELILRAQHQAQRDRQESQIAAQQEIVDLAIDVSTRLIQENLDDEKHRSLARRFLADMGQLE